MSGKKLQKVSAGDYKLIENGKVVGEVRELYVGPHGSASARWLAVYNGKHQLGPTRRYALDIVGWNN